VSTVFYRRKPLVVTSAKQSDLTDGWVVIEGDVMSVYTNEEFERLFDKVELQADMVPGGPDTDIFGFDYSWCKDEFGRRLINELLGIEMASIDNNIDGNSWMFKPYPLSTFGRLVGAIEQDMEEGFDANVKFLEVGCGIGAKLVLVSKLFGFQVTGFDYNLQYCNDACELLHHWECQNWVVENADALSVTALEYYQASDVIYLNRPFVHLEQQGELEHLVLERMRPGAYVILANYAAEPSVLAQSGWREIARDKLAIVLQKP